MSETMKSTNPALDAFREYTPGSISPIEYDPVESVIAPFDKPTNWIFANSIGWLFIELITIPEIVEVCDREWRLKKRIIAKTEILMFKV